MRFLIASALCALLPAASLACTDSHGRPGKYASCNHCYGDICDASSCTFCDVSPVPATLGEDGAWTCPDTYALKGARFIPGGGGRPEGLKIEPEHCAPEWLPHKPYEPGSESSVIIVTGGSNKADA